jgi:hypothetical protein
LALVHEDLLLAEHVG